MSSVGGRFGPDKEVPWAPQRVALGVHARLDKAVSDGTAVFEPKHDAVAGLQASVARRRQEGRCTPAQAAKIRGQAVWTSTHTFNMVGRLGLAALKRRQYYDTSSAISEHLDEGFRFLSKVLPLIPPRQLNLLESDKAPVVIYSDASWPCSLDGTQNDPPRVGWVIHVPGMTPRAWSMILPPEAMRGWMPRKTQIFAAEAIVPLIAAQVSADLLRGRDVVWFTRSCRACASASTLMQSVV